MPKIYLTNLKAALFGFDAVLGPQLASALAKQGCRITFLRQEPATASVAVLPPEKIDIVFCPARKELYSELLQSIKKERQGIPVVVASRLSETAEWLDAMESGATDYCSAPFEADQMAWILDNALRYSHAAVA